MIVGIVPPDAGEVLINGQALRGDTDPAKAAIGLVPQDLALFDELPARENLRFFGSLYGLAGARPRRRPSPPASSSSASPTARATRSRPSAAG